MNKKFLPLLLLVAIAATVVVSGALYTMLFTVSNSGGATTDEIVFFPISGQSLSSGGFIQSDTLDAVIANGDQSVPSQLPSLQLAMENAVADDGGATTDELTEANNATVDDMTLLPATPVVDDAYLFGGDWPFRILTLTTSTAGVGVWTITWEYWNGSAYVALTNVDDRTSGFTVSGIRTVSFNLPTDWVENLVQGRTAYHIQGRVSDFTSIVTQPLGQQAFWETGSWIIHVASIGQNEQVQYEGAFGGPDIVSGHQFFPGEDGYTAVDDATLELGSTYLLRIVAFIHADGADPSREIVNKTGAIRIHNPSSGTIRVTLNGSTDIDVTSVTDGEYTIDVFDDGVNTTLSIFGVGSASDSSVTIADNGAEWEFGTEGAVSYFDSISIGFPVQDVDDTTAEWDAGTLVDTDGVADAGNGHLELLSEGEWDGSGFETPIGWSEIERSSQDVGWEDDCTVTGSNTCFEGNFFRGETPPIQTTFSSLYQQFTASSGEAWSIQGQCQTDILVPGSPGPNFELGVEFLDSGLSSLADNRSPETCGINVWNSMTLQNQIAPATTAFVRLSLWMTSQAISSRDRDVWWDAIVGCQCTSTPSWPAASGNSIVNPSFESTHTSTGTRVSPAFNVTSVTDVIQTSILWNETTAAGETVSVEFSTNAGVDYTAVTNGGSIPDVNTGDDLSGASDYHSRVTFTGSGAGTPEIDNLNVTVLGAGGDGGRWAPQEFIGLTLSDLSGNDNTLTASYPVRQISSIAPVVGALTSTGNVEVTEIGIGVPEVVGEATGGETLIIITETGANLPLGDLWIALADFSDIPVQVFWMTAILFFAVLTGMALVSATGSLAAGAFGMGFALLVATGIGTGLIPQWILIFYIIAAIGALVWSRTQSPAG
ncbi:hypothetical protein LCGC14_1118420 [marine sediment metagenome]|uniref:Uncharacterized protein n=1 Tax=marine sediment metagenome TaxID=412755 RepID=A0A0F9QAJ7_9ZZZZ